MKKLMIMIPLAIGMAAFAAGCTTTSIEEDEYKNQIEAVDISKIHRPGEKDKDNTGE